ncbi:uncharacterized protein LOC141680398 [Apium graveolens]|uniref:uncharacterized protein LOC141680398 n=1 Tax=Apium graveolens TaxID=4045 RepID=UPI003D797407
MLKLHNWKSRFGISDAAFTELMSSLGSFLPTGHVLPVNAYEEKKNLSALGLDYIKFHVCPNDWILYRGIYSESYKCPKCNLSRWKLGKDGRVRTNIPAKVVWFFPIIPRFKRLFKSASTAEIMTCHSDHRIQDGLMRHPADSPSWRNVDQRWPSFGSESRNLRLALSADGINPHNNGLTNRYSCWPVVLSNAVWIINDFPAYGNMSGCINKGYIACPVCCEDTIAKYLTHSRKMCYQGHRRYLPRHHPYRRQKATFNGEQENGHTRQPLSGEEVLAEQQQVKFTFGKELKSLRKVECVWKKKSILFELDYWKFHHVRHCLDVMHIEKNVCNNLIGTLLNMWYKSKDSEASHRDMMKMGVRADLAPQVGEKKTYLPLPLILCQRLKKRKCCRHSYT